MGTRADFYVGEGVNAEWVGSVAWDGYEWGERIERGDHDALTGAKTEEAYRAAVAALLASRKDGTTPEMGWPWPWEDSRTTDCAYCFADGTVKAFAWGRAWDADESAPEASWPDFSNQPMSAPPGSARSGIMVFRA